MKTGGQMTPGVENAISQLITDSCGIEFTGFITIARVAPPPLLAGEVWRHVRAEPSGLFADGHRIQTSQVVEVHFAGDSVWVVTETGSRYGIISFAASGWQWFFNLMRESDRRPTSPECVIHHEEVSPVIGKGSLKPRSLKLPARPKVVPVDVDSSREGKRHPFRPPSDAKYLQQIEANFDRTIAELREHGLVTSHRKLSGPSEGPEN
ncbi:hypothetical protein [Pseudomonas sp. RIT-To-2]|uniref:hypothetical protein n=1 Tax=Pseudomonas sp. RIT-To-2 TaxID=3462541 RepID=UPI0024134B4D